MENALYRDPRISEAAAVGVPDERLGEVVAAVVSVKPAFQGAVTEAALIALAHRRWEYSALLLGSKVTPAINRLPKFAVPEMIVILHTPFSK